MEVERNRHFENLTEAIAKYDRERGASPDGKITEERRKEAVAVFEEMRGPLLEVLRKERNQREALSLQFTSVSLTLAKTRNALQDLVVFVQERIYWVPDADPIGRATFADARKELRKLPVHYDRVGSGFWEAVASRPLRSAVAGGGALLICAAFFLIPAIVRRRRIKRNREKRDEQLGWRKALRHTIEAVVVAGLPALALLVVGWLMRGLYPEQGMSLALPRLLSEVAFFYFLWKLSAYLLSRHGVAVRYMGMPRDLAKQIHFSVRLLAFAGMAFEAPAIVLKGSLFEMEALPRLLHTAANLAFVVSMILVIRPRAPLAIYLTRPGGWLRRIWFVVGPLLILVFAAAAIMEYLGYRLGAEFVINNALSTGGGIIALVALYRLRVKGVEAIANAVRRHTMEEEGATAAWESWEQVRGQLTRIVATVVLVIAVLTLLHFWGAQTYILAYLEDVKLVEVKTDQWLTLAGLFAAILWIMAGHFLVHNLSALYEFVIVPLAGQGTRGGRYVALTLARYGILVFAYGAALVTLGLDYTKLAWLATALSVGLGFGLQEIVANFISGLILLVERPFTVGESITVGDKEGDVEKIAMRATTVINWDKQTIIIPNKEFITKELTNWTRNENVMRRKILVGVAYGSDVEEVLKILEETGRAHPKVLAKPPVRIFFIGFGESSLDFELWVYTKVNDGLNTRSELYAQVYEALNEANIEIPFPQRDLYLRSGKMEEQHPTRSRLADESDAADLSESPAG